MMARLGSIGRAEFSRRQQPINGFAAFTTDPQQNLGANLLLTTFRVGKVTLTHTDPVSELGLGHVRAS